MSIRFWRANYNASPPRLTNEMADAIADDLVQTIIRFRQGDPSGAEAHLRRIWPTLRAMFASRHVDVPEEPSERYIAMCHVDSVERSPA